MKRLKEIDWENTYIDMDLHLEEKNAKLKDIYCEHWKQAEIGLQLAKMAVKKPLAKLIIEIAIRIGNGIFDRNCK